MLSAPAKCAVVLLTVINKSKHDKRAAVPSKSLNKSISGKEIIFKFFSLFKFIILS